MKTTLQAIETNGHTLKIFPKYWSHQSPDTKKSLAMVLNYTLPRTVETIEQRNQAASIGTEV